LKIFAARDYREQAAAPLRAPENPLDAGRSEDVLHGGAFFIPFKIHDASSRYINLPQDLWCAMIASQVRARRIPELWLTASSTGGRLGAHTHCQNSEIDKVKR
jgi:hypothetical protein